MPTGRRCCATLLWSIPTSGNISKRKTTIPKACSGIPEPCRRSWARECKGGESEIILDGDQLAAEHEYFKFGGTRHSPDHRLQAWSADVKGSEYFAIRVRDWATRADLGDLVEETDGAVGWSTDCESFF